MKYNLDEDDRSTIVNAMRVASERYSEQAQHCRDMIAEGESRGEDVGGIRQLRQQFERQAKDSLRLAESIEEAESVIVEK